jgi:hypothetical protein
VVLPHELSPPLDFSSQHLHPEIESAKDSQKPSKNTGFCLNLGHLTSRIYTARKSPKDYSLPSETDVQVRFWTPDDTKADLESESAWLDDV